MPEPIPLRSVEMHAAFLWTCEDCGRDSFHRGITLDDQLAERLTSAATRAEADAILAELSEGAPEGTAYGGSWLIQPTVVACEHCGSRFETEG
jgi:hypothetical protein